MVRLNKGGAIMKLSKKEVITIVILYILFLVIVSGPAMASNSTVGFWIILIVGLFCYFRFTKGRLNDKLSQFIWPVWLVGMLILGSTIGIFIAPYHLGKWIASKIPDNNVDFNIYDNKGIGISEEDLKKKSDQELEEMYRNVIHIVIPASEEPATKRIPNNLKDKVYGCKTWGEGRELIDLLAKVKNERLKK